MKISKYFAMVAMAVGSIIATSTNASAAETEQNPTRTLIEMALEEVEDTLPMDLGDGMTMTRMYVSYDKLIIECTCPNDIVDLMSTVSDPSMKNLLLTSVASDESTKLLLDLCVEADMGFAMVYTNPSGTNSATLSYSTSDLASIIK